LDDYSKLKSCIFENTFSWSSLYGGSGAYIRRISAKQHAAYDFTSLSLWKKIKCEATDAVKASNSVVCSPWSTLVKP
jgi:hypothetical protein